MNEMVERVARAICGDPNDDGRNVLAVHRHRARLAIAAMREPTDAMYEAISNDGKMWREKTSTQGWQTMIDEALKES